MKCRISHFFQYRVCPRFLHSPFGMSPLATILLRVASETCNFSFTSSVDSIGLSISGMMSHALQVMEKECADEVKLLTDMFGLKLDTANKFYAMRETDIAEKFSMYKGATEAINAENRRAMEAEFGLYKSQIDADFGLYKNQRDQYDALQAKYCDLDKKVAVMEALTPYKEKLMMAYVNEKCSRKIDGVLGLQSAPTVTVLPSASICGCAATSTPTTGA